MQPTYIIGDIHGHYGKLVQLLQKIMVIDQDLAWIGQDANVWFMGDFFDRGPNGIGVVDLIRRLQREAEAAGGAVSAILGNHETLILAAYYFGGQIVNDFGFSFYEGWQRNGGLVSDLESLTDDHIAWLTNLPAMVLLDDTLLVHADSLMYTRYGQSVAEVNQAMKQILQGDDVLAWGRLLDEFSERNVFVRSPTEGPKLAQLFLKAFGGQRIIHGHTPISRLTRQPPNEVVTPLIYADELCVNVDGGLYLGGLGVVFQVNGE